MLAFAGNSLLCRAALGHARIDAASFTTIRLLSGAVMLWIIVRLRSGAMSGAGNWPSAIALFVYAAGFSFAYMRLPAATGALLLFGTVQTTMIGYGLWGGERFKAMQWAGLWLAIAGLVILLLPGLYAPPLGAALMMLGAGIAWSIYSLRGKDAGDATCVTAGNFMRAVPVSVGLSALMLSHATWNISGVCAAIASGALTSGVGYAIWYTVLPSLKSTQAATVQLSVPLIAAFGAVALLGEALTPRLMLASVAIVGGITLVILRR